MEKKSTQLNDEQFEAVNYFDGNLRIIAGAGSGKTRVITEKMNKIITDKLAPEWEILAITFTNKATREMQERLEKHLGHKPMVSISTYHSFCLKIIRQEYESIGLDRYFNLIDGLDKTQIIKKIVKPFKELLDIKISAIRIIISSWKREGVYPDEIKIKDPMDFEKIHLQKIYKKYQDTLKERNSIDMDDIIYLTDKILDDEVIRQKWASKYKYILVDEFQDTDEIQFSIIKKLSTNSMLTVVGDPDQTIYSWRGAKSWILNNLDRELDNLKTVVLNTNYRSSSQILAVANRVISNNSDRIPKELVAIRSGQLPYYYHAVSQYDEAKFVTHVISDLIAKGVSKNEIAILFRAAYCSRNVEQHLVENSIDYQIYGGIKFYEREEIKDSISYLKTFYLKDETSLVRIINKPSRKIGDVTLGKLISYADTHGITLYDLIFNHTNKAKEICKQIGSFIDSFRNLSMSNKISKNLAHILKDSGYLENLRGTINEFRRLNLEELKRALDEFEKNAEEPLDVFTESLISNKEDSASDESVKLMTVHAAKGLEFKHVIIIGLNDGIFPSRRSVEEGGINEERRLFYVAATRAKIGLYLTSWFGRNFDGTMTSPSNFLREIGSNFYQNPSVKNESKKITNHREAEVNFINGEIIHHDVFGPGVVLAGGKDRIQVAFKKPHGVKTLKANHIAIKKQSA